MKGKLYLSYYPCVQHSKGLRASVSSYIPSYMRNGSFDFNINELAPNKIDRDKLKNKQISWREFIESYSRKLMNEEQRKALLCLGELLDRGCDVTLFCFEKTGVQCHRYILGEVFKQLDYEVYSIDYHNNVVEYNQGDVLMLKEHVC